MAAGTVRIEGLAELNRAFKKMEGDLDKGLRKALKEGAEPVKDLAQSYALGRISHMPRSPRWAEQRIGVTARTVYIVPRAKRRGGSGRPNLKGLLLGLAMEPALVAKSDEVEEAAVRMLDSLARKSGF